MASSPRRSERGERPLLAPRVAEKMRRRIGRDRDGEDGRARGRDRVVRICGAGDGAERWRGAGHSRVMEMGDARDGVEQRYGGRRPGTTRSGGGGAGRRRPSRRGGGGGGWRASLTMRERGRRAQAQRRWRRGSRGGGGGRTDGDFTGRALSDGGNRGWLRPPDFNGRRRPAYSPNILI